VPDGLPRQAGPDAFAGATIFGDGILVATMIDRLVHRAEVNLAKRRLLLAQGPTWAAVRPGWRAGSHQLLQSPRRAARPPCRRVTTRPHAPPAAGPSPRPCGAASVPAPAARSAGGPVVAETFRTRLSGHQLERLHEKRLLSRTAGLSRRAGFRGPPCLGGSSPRASDPTALCDPRRRRRQATRPDPAPTGHHR
jgi:hypothetical protein